MPTKKRQNIFKNIELIFHQKKPPQHITKIPAPTESFYNEENQTSWPFPDDRFQKSHCNLFCVSITTE